jgi:hypothetical protein
MFSDALLLTTADLPAPDWKRLGEHLPYEWIEDALAYTGRASIRQRRLPAQQVVWLVISLALFRHRSVRQVMAELDLALPDLADRCVTDSAVTQARQRLGEDPLAWLFTTSARAWHAQDEHRDHFGGLRLLAMDGTSLKLADSPANREHFDAPRFAAGAVASYPHARMVTLTALNTQLVLAAQFGPCSLSEKALTLPLLEEIPDQSLTVLDKGFMSAELLGKLRRSGQERHFIVPAKSNQQWELIEGTGEDGIVKMAVTAAARKFDPELGTHWRARAVRGQDGDGKEMYLLTSLTDKKRFPARAVRQLHSERWKIETSYRELKQSMMGMALSLRSQSVAATRQEIWGCLIAYNLIRLEMARVADEAKCEPTEISFVLALHAFQFEMMHAAALQAQGNLPGVLKRMRERMIQELNVYRPGRKFARVAKAKPQRYPERRLKKPLT